MQSWWLVLGMAAITFSLRYSLFAWPQLRFPPLLRKGLHFVPTAVLSAILLPGLLMPGGGPLQLGWENAYLLGGLAAVLIALLSRHLLATILGGLLVFFSLRWLNGQLPL
jgi:branched-subunit amino acid transport protein